MTTHVYRSYRSCIAKVSRVLVLLGRSQVTGHSALGLASAGSAWAPRRTFDYPIHTQSMIVSVVKSPGMRLSCATFKAKHQSLRTELLHTARLLICRV